VHIDPAEAFAVQSMGFHELKELVVSGDLRLRKRCEQSPYRLSIPDLTASQLPDHEGVAQDLAVVSIKHPAER